MLLSAIGQELCHCAVASSSLQSDDRADLRVALRGARGSRMRPLRVLQVKRPSTIQCNNRSSHEPSLRPLANESPRAGVPFAQGLVPEGEIPRIQLASP